MVKPTFENGPIKLWDVPQPKNVEPHAQISSWFIEGPFHPIWNQWVMLMIHLRDVPGKPKAVKKYEHNTHEFLTLSVDPKNRAKPEDMNTPGVVKTLTPVDVVVQFQVDTDEQALQVMKLAAKAILTGHASPDQDFRRWWEESIAATAKHIREGHDCTKGGHVH